MQRTLTFTYNKAKYVSKPFDFEAFCLVSEQHMDERVKSTFTCTKEALSHMFEGTDATDDILLNIPVATKARMCRKIWDWYMEDLTLSSKNE